MREEMRRVATPARLAKIRVRLERARAELALCLSAREEGQAMTEYVMVTVALLGGTVLSWPFLVELIDALNIYYKSIYTGLECPLP